MVNKYKYTGKNRKYLNKQVIEYMKSLEIPEAYSDLGNDVFELMNIIHKKAVLSTDFIKVFGEILDYNMIETFNNWTIDDRFINRIYDIYLSTVIHFIAIDVYKYSNYEGYENVLSGLDISTIRMMISMNLSTWLERVLIKTQELFLSEGIIEKRSYEEIEKERRENAMDEKMFWEEYGSYIDLD